MSAIERLPFEFFEVHKVAEYEPADGSGRYVETLDTPQEQEFADDEAVSQFWTVYGYRQWPEDEHGNVDLTTPGYGTTAIADLTDQASAIDLAIALAGGDEGRVEVFG